MERLHAIAVRPLTALIIATALASQAAGAGHGSTPYPVPLEPKLPLGSLIYEGSAEGTIATPGETLHFEIHVDPGQTLTAIVLPDASLQATVEISRGAELASAAANAPGDEVVAQTASIHGRLGKPGPPGFGYRVSVGGIDDTLGDFTLRLVLNAAAELESFGGPDNGAIESAQDLAGSFLSLLRANDAGPSGPLPDRSAVLGHSGGPHSVLASEDFESGALGPDLSAFSSTANGRIEVTGALGTAAGAFALLMDTSIDGPFNLNEVIWTVDLSGVPDAMLSFFHADYNDEEDLLPADFVGSVAGDGVAISDDGLVWHTVLNAEPGEFGVWNEVTVDLGAEAAAAGMSLGAGFQIKFQQFDNFPLTTDGRGYDEIEITLAEDDDFYRFELQAGESVTLAVTGQNEDGLRLDLLDASGEVVAEGLARDVLIENGSFETGDFTGWSTSTTGIPFLPWAVSSAGAGSGFGMAPTEPQDGSFVAWNGFDGDGPMEFTLFQDVMVPNGSASAMLEWRDRIQWNFQLGAFASLPRLYDVEIRDPGSNAVLDTLFAYSTGTQSTNPTGDTGWQIHTADLSAHAGSSVRLFFRERIPQAFTGPAQLEIDGVRFRANTVPSNVDDLVRNFQSDEAATYFARVAGHGDVDYSLLVLPNAEFDLEENDGIEAAQEILSPVAAARKWVIGHVGSASVGTLYGASRDGELFTVDLATGTGTFVGLLPGGGSTEIEFDALSQRAFTQFRNGSFAIQQFDIDTGAGAGPAVFDGAAYNGLEFVGPTLYGTAISGPRRPSALRRLDPLTGTSTSVGLTGVGPIAGLAYDESTAVMYGIGGGSGAADLYIVDLLSGAASVVGSTGFQAGSLEFGPDGVLYGGGTGPNAGNLYRIDRLTGAASLVGATGFSTVTGLTLRPGAAAADTDFYRVELSDRVPLEVETRTPADGSGEFGNELDPLLNLYDALGNLVATDRESGADGRNARLFFHVPSDAGGSYFVEVAAEGETQGEYILSLKGTEPRGRPRVTTSQAPAVLAMETLAVAQNASPDGFDYQPQSPQGCGMGAELVLVLPPLLWLRSWRRRRRS